MVILFIIIIVIIVISFSLNTPKRKGIKGESRVAWELKKLQNEEFKVFNDVLLRTRNGSSQIDHIVISKYGIFVIETKNFSGWIHGNEKSEYWTQTFYKKKSKFRNPIKQNWAHIYALKEVLADFKYLLYHPIVVFSGSAELKNINSKIPVIYSHELIQTIMDKKGISSLSIEQVKNIENKLKQINIQDKKIKKEHVYQVKDHIYEQKDNEKRLVCPRCNGKLVVRKGKYGKFFGCSNYPKCKYTQKY